jgi:RND family efflux transporter MFP subunit
VSAARAAEDTARLNLEYTRIKAPVSGRIGNRLVTVGNLVQGSSSSATVLATIVSLDPIYFYFDVNERDFLTYRTNHTAGETLGNGEINLPCELALNNDQGYAFKGRVNFFDNQVAEKTGTIRMRAVFDNANRFLVPGLFGMVRLPAGPPEKTLLIPAVAVMADQDHKYVLVVNRNNVVEPRSVVIGRQHGLMRSVREGLTPQDRVVVNGMLMARPGSKVEVAEAPPEGTAASKNQ